MPDGFKTPTFEVIGVDEHTNKFNEVLGEEMKRAEKQMMEQIMNMPSPFSHKWEARHELRVLRKRLRKGRTKGIIVDRTVLSELIELAETALAFEEDDPEVVMDDNVEEVDYDEDDDQNEQLREKVRDSLHPHDYNFMTNQEMVNTYGPQPTEYVHAPPPKLTDWTV